MGEITCPTPCLRVLCGRECGQHRVWEWMVGGACVDGALGTRVLWGGRWCFGSIATASRHRVVVAAAETPCTCRQCQQQSVARQSICRPNREQQWRPQGLLQWRSSSSRSTGTMLQNVGGAQPEVVGAAAGSWCSWGEAVTQCWPGLVLLLRLLW